MSAHNYVSWEWHQRTDELLDKLSSTSSLPIVALETVENQPDIYHYTFPSCKSGKKEKRFISLSPAFSLSCFLEPLSYSIISLVCVCVLIPSLPFFLTGGCILLVGNERHGIEANLLKKCKDIVRIPCVGIKNSLNVGVAFGICLYEISRQWHHEQSS